MSDPELIRTILPLRFRQWRRTSADMGPVLWLAMAALLVVPLLLLHEYAQNLRGGLAMAAGAAVLLVSIHHMRRDRRLLIHLTQHPQRIMAAEYLVFSLPLAVLLAAALNPAALLLLWLVCIAVAYLPAGNEKQNSKGLWGGWIPAYLFEWKAGWRRLGWLMALFYLATWALVWAPYASMLFLWLCFGVTSTFYAENEPMGLLIREELPPARFLQNKIRHHVGLGLALMAPPLLVYIVLHPEHWIIAAAFGVLNTLQLYYFVVGKYARYRAGVKVQSGSLLTSLVSLSVVVPFLIPLSPILCVRDTVLALRRLKPYLNIYHA